MNRYSFLLFNIIGLELFYLSVLSCEQQIGGWMYLGIFFIIPQLILPLILFVIETKKPSFRIKANLLYTCCLISTAILSFISYSFLLCILLDIFLSIKIPLNLYNSLFTYLFNSIFN